MPFPPIIIGRTSMRLLILLEQLQTSGGREYFLLGKTTRHF